MQKRYKLSINNPNQSLDLKNQKIEVEAVMDEIRNGGKTGKAFNEVKKIDVVDISEREIILEVDEIGEDWHREVGKKLANNHGMRSFCNPDDDTEMFKWEEI